MDKSTKFLVFTSFIYDNKNEGLLHKSNRLLIVSAIIYIPFFPISVFRFIVYHADCQQLTNNISLLRKI